MSRMGHPASVARFSYSLEYRSRRGCGSSAGSPRGRIPLARYFAIPAATSLRSPESFSRAALTIIRWQPRLLLPFPRSENAIAWCSAIGLPKVCAAGVTRGKFEGAQRHPHRAGRYVDPSDLDAVHHLVEALAGRTAQDVVGAGAIPVEDELSVSIPL